MKTSVRLLTLTLAASALTVSAQNPIESQKPIETRNPIEAQLLPPDFLLSQREALGLDESQLHAIQGIVQEVQPQFEKLKGRLEDRVDALREVLQPSQPDNAQAEARLRALLSDESEMKLLQLRTMLNLLGKLTATQVEKARALHAGQAGGENPMAGLRERLQKKFGELVTAIQVRAAGGEMPTEVVTEARELQRLARDGSPQEAERRLDALLAKLRDGKAKP